MDGKILKMDNNDTFLIVFIKRFIITINDTF